MCIETLPVVRRNARRARVRVLPVRQRGLTLIELVVFIVVISIGLAGILGALNFTTRYSANPMLLKQQVAIAESLLEEIESKPFTWCDPDDANVATAAGAGGCASTVQGITATAGETRFSQVSPLDNVGDYGGFAMSSGILDPSNAPIVSLANYTARVAITQVGTAAPFNLTDQSAVLRIDVTVGAPGGQPDLTLTGYRMRYAPNAS